MRTDADRGRSARARLLAGRALLGQRLRDGGAACARRLRLRRPRPRRAAGRRARDESGVAPRAGEMRLPVDRRRPLPNPRHQFVRTDRPLPPRPPGLVGAERLGSGEEGHLSGIGIAPMYQPPHFREDRHAVQHALIRTNPLGLLITAGPGGLQANPVPFLIDSDASAKGTLRAHLARANPQLQELARVEECLIVFQGPQHYVTPSWYATKRETGKVVPTWNYITLHAWGQPKVIDDAGWLRDQVGALTASQENARSTPWTVDEAPTDFLP